MVALITGTYNEKPFKTPSFFFISKEESARCSIFAIEQITALK